MFSLQIISGSPVFFMWAKSTSARDCYRRYRNAVCSYCDDAYRREIVFKERIGECPGPWRAIRMDYLNHTYSSISEHMDITEK
jgi:hypothetical protein